MKLLILLSILASCASPRVIPPSTSQPAIFRDAIDSVEPRGNGVYALWRRQDSVAVYCVKTKEEYDRLVSIMTGEDHSGWIVGRYHTLNSQDFACANIENTYNLNKTPSETTFTIYVMDSFNETSNKQ